MTVYRRLALAVLLVVSAHTSPAAADPVFTALAALNSGGNFPYAPVIDSADNLYVIDNSLGGGVYKFSGGALTTFSDFYSKPTYCPCDRLVADAAGNLYGTSYLGVASSTNGAIFKLTPSGTLTTLVSFPSANGVKPGSLFTDAVGTLYTSAIDAAGLTSVFKINPSGTLTKLVSFSGPAQGVIPSVADTAGNFYGYNGTVFELTASGTVKTIATITGVNDLITDAAGNIYVTTSNSGTSNADTILKITPSGTLTPVATFTGPDSDRPVISLVDAAGNLYGTSRKDAAPNPAALGNVSSLIANSIVELSPSGTLTTLATTTFADGCGAANLVADAAGNLFGTTRSCFLGGGRIFTSHLFEISDSGFVVAGTSVPEPASLNMLGLFAAGLVALRRRRSTSPPIEAGGQQA